ncbi:MAG: DinB family protein [Vicinamibacterales bacterium]
MRNLLIDLDREIASTRRLLERYPHGKGDWQPHDKSRTLSGLATHVANIPNHGANILTTTEMDVATRQPQPPKDSATELLEAFDTGVTRLKSAIANIDAATLSERWTMRMGPRVLVSESRAMLMRLMVINHLVHHRAQLGVYLRLLNVPIPGMYGPSADEPV